MEDIALLALAAWLYYRFKDNLLFVVLVYAGLWYVSGGIVIPAVCLACSGIAYGGYRLAHWQQPSSPNDVDTIHSSVETIHITPCPRHQYPYGNCGIQDIPSFDSLMQEWDELHGVEMKPIGFKPAPKMPAHNRAIRNKWVSLRVTDALCLDGNHAFTAGGCRYLSVNASAI